MSHLSDTQRKGLKGAGFIAALFALFVLLGGHWLALQSIAWTRMLAQFSKTDSLVVAVAKTFDGKHPCKLCLSIRVARADADNESAAQTMVKLERLADLVCDLRSPAALEAVPEQPALTAYCRPAHLDFIDSPPTPPPRMHPIL